MIFFLKFLFLFTKNIQCMIIFLLILVIFLPFYIFDHVAFSFKFILLIYPILQLAFFNIEAMLAISVFYDFSRDLDLFWTIFTLLILYHFAAFYQIYSYSDRTQEQFCLNPIYLYIHNFHKIIIFGEIPQLSVHQQMLGELIVVLTLGALFYQKCNTNALCYG